MEKMYLCDYCIRAIKSRGEQLFRGELAYSENENVACDWCGDDGDYLL